jgi:putative tryptophan/tyrosine transport system substrate-binding protein
MNKRLFTFFITVVIIGVCCQGYAADTRIGVAWIGKSGMANRVTAGLEKGFNDSGKVIEIEFQKELETPEELAGIVDRWQSEKDGMVILRSNGAKWLKANPPRIPTFIGGCNNPMQLGAVKNMEAPEGNITGVTYYLPVDTQFEVFKAIVPDITSILLLVEKGHPGSLIDQEATRAICEKLNIQYNEAICGSEEETIAVVKEHKDKVSAMIIGSEALVIDLAGKIVAAAGKTPVFSYSSKPVKAGALGGFVADDGKLGEMLSASVIDVLVNGKAISEIPVKVDPTPKFYINAVTAEKIGADIPYEILELAEIIDNEGGRIQ